MRELVTLKTRRRSATEKEFFASNNTIMRILYLRIKLLAAITCSESRQRKAIVALVYTPI